ncbi:IS5 family transposase [Streptomyces sp. NPDC090798]|uniref:IS5 family transposase n=1 Tax=Streptomyces sp. NPDC090798 TaxID=3365968 RepID=UPI0037F7C363
MAHLDRDPWRDVPDQYDPWESVYELFRRWQLAGTWALIVAALQALADEAGHVAWDVSVDSGTARAHQHAARARKDPGGQKEPPGPESADHGLGRSRGGLTSRCHLAVDQGQKPLAVMVTAGQWSDSPQFSPVLGRIRVARLHGDWPRTRPDRVLGDKACGSRANRRYLWLHGIRCTIPEKTDQIANGRAKAGQEAALARSTRRSASSGTPWNAGSIASSATGASPPAMTVRMVEPSRRWSDSRYD